MLIIIIAIILQKLYTKYFIIYFFFVLILYNNLLFWSKSESAEKGRVRFWWKWENTFFKFSRKGSRP